MPRGKDPAYLRRWRQYDSPQKKLLRSHPSFEELNQHFKELWGKFVNVRYHFCRVSSELTDVLLNPSESELF